MPPNVCATLFNIKDLMIDGNRTGTRAFSNLESALDMLMKNKGSGKTYQCEPVGIVER